MPESGGVYERLGENGNCPAGPKTWQWASHANEGGVKAVGELASGRGPGTVRSSGKSCAGFVDAIVRPIRLEGTRCRPSIFLRCE